MDTHKKELRVALIWIVVYVVTASIGEQLNGVIGLQGGATAPIGLLLTVALCLYLSRNKLFSAYGFSGFSQFPFRQVLYCLPMIALATVNLWRGGAIRFSTLEMALYIGFMLCTGFIEEVLFRGFLFKAMLSQGTGVAVLVSSLTFGLGHIVNLLNGAELLPTLLQLVYAMAIGLMLSVFVLRTGNIIPCIGFHSIFNALSAFSNEAGTTNGYRVTISAIITAVALGYAGWLWFRLGKGKRE